MAHFEKASKEGARIAEKTAEVQTNNFSTKGKHASKVLAEDFVISIFVHDFICWLSMYYFGPGAVKVKCWRSSQKT